MSRVGPSSQRAGEGRERSQGKEREEGSETDTVLIGYIFLLAMLSNTSVFPRREKEIDVYVIGCGHNSIEACLEDTRSYVPFLERKLYAFFLFLVGIGPIQEQEKKKKRVRFFFSLDVRSFHLYIYI